MNEFSRVFLNHDVRILEERNSGRTVLLFLAADIAKVLDMTNIRVSIQNYDEDEKCMRRLQTIGGTQDALYLTSHGVYRLLYSSKKPIAKQFRKWVGNIIDDILFNECNCLRQELASCQNTIRRLQITGNDAWIQCFDHQKVVYFGRVNENGLMKFGWSDDIRQRTGDHRLAFDMFELLWVVPCKDNRCLEARIKNDAVFQNHIVSMTIKGHNHTELMQIGKKLTWKKLVMTVNKMKEEVEQALIGNTKLDVLNAEIKLVQEKNKLRSLQLRRKLRSLQFRRNPKSLREHKDKTQSFSIINDQTQIASANSELEVMESQIPHIHDLSTISQLHEYWLIMLQPYFSEHAKPPWLKQFGKQQHAMKLRFFKQEAICLYIDWVAHTMKIPAHEVIQSLQQICVKHSVNERHFITDIMYSYVCGYNYNRELSPSLLASELHDHGLPCPGLKPKEMRKLLWPQRCKTGKVTVQAN